MKLSSANVSSLTIDGKSALISDNIEYSRDLDIDLNSSLDILGTLTVSDTNYNVVIPHASDSQYGIIKCSYTNGTLDISI